MAGDVRVGGAYSGNRNRDSFGSIVHNDNVGIVSDYGPAGLIPDRSFFDEVLDLGGYEPLTETCSLSPASAVIFCQGNSSLRFDQMEGKSVVVDGAINVSGNAEGQNVFVVASGSVDFSGMGGNRFRGVVWSGGSLVFKGQGGTSYEGSFISAGSSTFNGGLDITQLSFEEAAPMNGGGSNGMLWEEF